MTDERKVTGVCVDIPEIIAYHKRINELKALIGYRPPGIIKWYTEGAVISEDPRKQKEGQK